MRYICPKIIPKPGLTFMFLLLMVVFTALDSYSQNAVAGTINNDSVTGKEEIIPNQTENEFTEFNDINAVKSTDEFSEFNADEGAGSIHCNNDESCNKREDNLIIVLSVLLLTLLTGLLVKWQVTRNLRGLFLIASIAFLGFWKGACPCPISSFQNVILAGMGENVHWQSLVWFLGLIPVTYLAGRVYCGWICHLGALQEIMYFPGKIRILQGEKAQKIMRWIRIGFLVILVVQLSITKTNLFKHYDPFKAAFNLMASNTLTWILLGLLLVSSLFIFRPFCKTVCPVGLILGWINKIPGARVVGNNGACTGCKTCDNTCQIRAITRETKFSRIDNQECIACGNCIGNCRKNSLLFFRNNKKTHHDKITCTPGTSH
jgi:polyferredoxin